MKNSSNPNRDICILLKSINCTFEKMLTQYDSSVIQEAINKAEPKIKIDIANAVLDKMTRKKENFSNLHFIIEVIKEYPEDILGYRSGEDLFSLILINKKENQIINEMNDFLTLCINHSLFLFNSDESFNNNMKWEFHSLNSIFQEGFLTKDLINNIKKPILKKIADRGMEFYSSIKSEKLISETENFYSLLKNIKLSQISDNLINNNNTPTKTHIPKM